MRREAPIGQSARPNGPRKIQSICNGKLTPITMQVLARTSETSRARKQWVSMEKQYEEQWEAMKKTMRGAMETMKIRTRACVRLRRKTGDSAARGSSHAVCALRRDWASAGLH